MIKTKKRIEVTIGLSELMTVDDIIAELEQIKRIDPELKLEYDEDLTFYKLEAEEELFDVKN